MRTLWVEGSPKGKDSLSSALAEAFLAAAGTEATGLIQRLNVWTDELPSADRDVALAKFALLLGDPITEQQREKWRLVVNEIEKVRQFDRIVVSSPMWNWSIPHPLKAWIDVIAQPGHSFTLDAQGRHIGALGEDKPLHLILTRSSTYDGRHPELQDFQLPYLDYVFTILGYRVDAMVIEPTTHWHPDTRIQFRQNAITQARERGALLTAKAPPPT